MKYLLSVLWTAVNFVGILVIFSWFIPKPRVVSVGTIANAANEFAMVLGVNGLIAVAALAAIHQGLEVLAGWDK